MENILKNIQKVAENSKYVKINKKELYKFSEEIKNHKVKHWTETCPVDLSNMEEEQKIAFLVIFNSISFNYWGNKKWNTTYKNQRPKRGTFCMLLALQRAIDEKKPILNPLYLSQLKKEDLKNILRGNCEIPLIEERLLILREIGSVIVEKYGGKFTNLLSNVKNNAITLLTDINKNFPSFIDKTEYNNEEIYFMKRAQLLISDLNWILKLNLKNNNKLTACADYILPMVLKHKKILEFDQLLEEKIKKSKQIIKGSKMETEIRVNTIMAVEMLKKKNNLTSMQINDILWLEGANIPEEEEYMKVLTTAY